jgi:hypothetical protein
MQLSTITATDSNVCCQEPCTIHHTPYTTHALVACVASTYEDQFGLRDKFYEDQFGLRDKFIEAHGAFGEVGKKPPEIIQAIMYTATEVETLVCWALKGLL